jgi:hypothetical protein
VAVKARNIGRSSRRVLEEKLATHHREANVVGAGVVVSGVLTK